MRSEIGLGCCGKDGKVEEGEKSSCLPFRWGKALGRCQHLVRISIEILVLTGPVVLEGSAHAHLILMTPGNMMYILERAQ